MGNSTLVDNNLSRIYVNLLNPLISILYFILPYTHIYKFNSLRLKKVLTIQKKALNFLSIYTIIQFLILNITGQFIKLPGEKLNYGTSFAYGLRRPWGFMIEPGNLALFLMFNLIVIYLIDDNFKLNLINILALILTFSTNGLISIFVFILLLFNDRKGISLKQRILCLVLFLFFIFIIIDNEYFYRAVIEKLTTDSFSKVDRLNNKDILLKIFNDYKFFGIGHGNFGFYRNLYGFDTKIPYKDFFDLSNNFYFGVLADTGMIGFALLLVYFKDIYNKIKIINKNKSKKFIIVLLIMLIPMPTILFSYISFYIGIIYAYSMNLYICINKKTR
ncbi:O-antigen ligase family protein [Clostridium colicanis]|uniref:O-antigen ligase family protein n=1 Tax=Clostridium colicanis TaxID=179628 RepID=UPI0014705B5E|nr:O-antigen ligase family protein [Clostridium colicanis]